MRKILILSLLMILLPITGLAKSITKVLKQGIPFVEQVKESNTRYIIKSDFKVEGDFVIPSNCILKFKGGSIVGKCSIKGNGTSIENGKAKVFGIEVALEGTWVKTDLRPEWFGAKGDGKTDDAIALYRTFLTASRIKIPVTLTKKGAYLYKTKQGNSLLGVLSYLYLKGNGAEISIGEVGDYDYVFRCVYSNGFSKVENLTLTLDDNNKLTDDTGRQDLPTRRTEFSLGGITGGIGTVEVDNVTINNAVGVWQFDLEAATGFLKNSTINWSKTQPATYDRTSIYLNCKDFSVCGNTLNGSDYAHTGIEFHGDEIRVHDNKILNYDVSVDLVNDVEKLDISKISSQQLYDNYIKTRYGVYLWTQNISNVNVDTVRISGNTIITTGSSDNDFSSCIAIYNVIGSNSHLNNLIVENNLLEQKGRKVYPIIDLACTRTGSKSSILNNVLITGNVIKSGNSASVVRLEGNVDNFQIQNIRFKNNIVYCNSSNIFVIGGYDNVECYRNIHIERNFFKNKRIGLYKICNSSVVPIIFDNAFDSVINVEYDN